MDTGPSMPLGRWEDKFGLAWWAGPLCLLPWGPGGAGGMRVAEARPTSGVLSEDSRGEAVRRAGAEEGRLGLLFPHQAKPKGFAQF